MDQTHQPAEAGGLPGQGPHLQLHSADEQLPAFVPLKLLLQPSGAVIEVDRPDMLIGRHTEADIRLPLPDVSRRHCRLQWFSGCWQVIDLNSLNGVQVNGEQVIQAPLEQGDLLRIGGFIFAVDLSSETESHGSRGHFDSIVKTLANQPRRAS